MGDPGQVPGGAEGSESQIAPRHDGTAHDTMLEENTLLRNTQHTSTFESATAPIDGDVSVDTLPNPLPQSIEIMQLLNELHTGIQSANRTALSADPYLAELLLGSGTSFENAIAIIGAVRDDDDARRLLQSYGIPKPLPASYSPPQLPASALLRHTNNGAPRSLASVKAAAAAHLPNYLESDPERQGLPSRPHSVVGGVYDPTPFRASATSSHTQLRSRAPSGAISGFGGAAQDPGQPASGTRGPPSCHPPPSSTARALDGRLDPAAAISVELSNVAALSAAAAAPFIWTAAGHGSVHSEPVFPEHRAFSEADLAALDARGADLAALEGRGPTPLPASLLDFAVPPLLPESERGSRGAALTGYEGAERAACNAARLDSSPHGGMAYDARPSPQLPPNAGSMLVANLVAQRTVRWNTEFERLQQADQALLATQQTVQRLPAHLHAEARQLADAVLALGARGEVAVSFLLRTHHAHPDLNIAYFTRRYIESLVELGLDRLGGEGQVRLLDEQATRLSRAMAEQQHSQYIQRGPRRRPASPAQSDPGPSVSEIVAAVAAPASPLLAEFCVPSGTEPARNPPPMPPPPWSPGSAAGGSPFAPFASLFPSGGAAPLSPISAASHAAASEASSELSWLTTASQPGWVTDVVRGVIAPRGNSVVEIWKIECAVQHSDNGRRVPVTVEDVRRHLDVKGNGSSAALSWYQNRPHLVESLVRLFVYFSRTHKQETYAANQTLRVFIDAAVGLTTLHVYHTLWKALHNKGHAGIADGFELCHKAFLVRGTIHNKDWISPEWRSGESVQQLWLRFLGLATTEAAADVSHGEAALEKVRLAGEIAYQVDSAQQAVSRLYDELRNFPTAAEWSGFESKLQDTSLGNEVRQDDDDGGRRRGGKSLRTNLAAMEEDTETVKQATAAAATATAAAVKAEKALAQAESRAEKALAQAESRSAKLETALQALTLKVEGPSNSGRPAEITDAMVEGGLKRDAMVAWTIRPDADAFAAKDVSGYLTYTTDTSSRPDGRLGWADCGQCKASALTVCKGDMSRCVSVENHAARAKAIAGKPADKNCVLVLHQGASCPKRKILLKDYVKEHPEHAWLLVSAGGL